MRAIYRLYFQATQAEGHVFNCLRELEIPGLWLVFFQGRSYGGKSFRKERNGKLIMREHDYVFFTSYNGQYFRKQQNKTTNEIILIMCLESRQDKF
jgi:hypothetical protein